MVRYVGIVYDDREPNRVMERFVSSVRNEVRSGIDRVLADFTDPDDGVRPTHLQYSIDEEPAVSLLLNQEELQLVVDCLNGTTYFNGPKCSTVNRIKTEFKHKLERCFSKEA